MMDLAMFVWSSFVLSLRFSSALFLRTDRYDAEVSWFIVVNRSSFRTNLIRFFVVNRWSCSGGGWMDFILCRHPSFGERRCDSSKTVQACCLDASIFVIFILLGIGWIMLRG